MVVEDVALWDGVSRKMKWALLLGPAVFVLVMGAVVELCAILQAALQRQALDGEL